MTILNFSELWRPYHSRITLDRRGQLPEILDHTSSATHVSVQMKTRSFGQSGIQVSETGLGCWQLDGSDWGAVDEADGLAILAAAEASLKLLGVEGLDLTQLLCVPTEILI